MSDSPLAGIRIADFTWAWAGPHATTLLAMLGAEVIKVESQQRIDNTRVRSITTRQLFEGLNQSTVFNQINLGKLSLSLNLSQSQGVELARKLVPICDVVTENMRPGAMEKLGLGYHDLKQMKPDLIYLSSSALGATGPHREYTGYAPNFAALSGLSYLTGYPDGDPADIRGEIDLFSATTAAFAILAALHYRLSTGQGQYIDLSSTEANVVLWGDVFLEFSMKGQMPRRQGNRDEHWAPHNCYCCQGEDEWLSIAVATEEEWQALCRVLGEPGWCRESRFATARGRWENQEELDKLLQAWICERPVQEAWHSFQQAGVAAMPSMSSLQLYQDPHLKERGVWQEILHPVLGRQMVLAPPWRLTETPAQIRGGAPLFGEHNDYVLRELLGLSREKIDALEREKVVW